MRPTSARIRRAATSGSGPSRRGQIPSHTNANRLYHGYHAHDPKRVLQIIEMFRVYTNYVWTGKDKSTPAMRFGLAKGPVRIEGILYWTPFDASAPLAPKNPQRPIKEAESASVQLLQLAVEIGRRPGS